MPKNKKPAGGRPAKNFEPRYGAQTSYQDRKRQTDASGQGRPSKPGSKSPGHRGYRAETTEPSAKRRWTAQERAGRDEARAIRSHAHDDAPRRPRATDRDDARGGYRGAEPRTRGAGDRVGRDDRRSSGDGRPSYSDRPARSQGADRPARSYDDRPRRSGDDRPRRSGDDRPARSYGDRPARSFDDRPRRSGDDRPARSFDDRPRRSGDDRPARSYGDRPARSFDDRPRRSGDDRPARSYGDRPRRSFDDRPRRDDRPVRSEAHEQHVDVVHDRLQAQAIQAEEVAETTFADLGLGENIVRTLADLGAALPFPIQAATIPAILEGKDVLARGRTGSGKTIAFGAPLVENVLRSQAGQRREFGRSPKALILAPTRELALQIDRTIQPIARSVGLFTTQIYGGVPQARQVGALRKGVDIIIGTPGRIEDLIEQRKLDLAEVQVVVLDEADHMSELGFLEPMQRILRLVADGAQKLLFSATLDREVASLVDEFLVDPAVYEVAGEDQESSTIEHKVLVIDHRDKAEILDSLVDRDGKTLVFARTRAYAEMLAEQFDDNGINAVALHGDLNQAKRTRNLQRLTDGRVQVLVATDVAARGIHVDDIDLVIQADPPDEYKTYLHRSGRTGRAGRTGTVVTLVTRQRRRKMTEMLDRAEIEAPFIDARPGDDVLEELAGRQVDPVA
ncbi:DEAD/DEAH box helicase [Microbacterium sp.]|uniref:DEAD/DEAH box helicase n=2 Tax=Microbacterium TaxID=33882 RepID=UPI000926C90A|nr:DEAD/DEAH box helicase [Microbacterium sp.]MBN9192403.1 DEAD/DEAH box helicase [Microbacterium sp.]OJU57222.1 MAG: RNA helicase [Microbacterium sp. 70-38]